MSSLAVVWHFWIGVFLAIPAVLLLVALIVGYLKNVTASRYPNENADLG